MVCATTGHVRILPFSSLCGLRLLFAQICLALPSQLASSCYFDSARTLPIPGFEGHQDTTSRCLGAAVTAPIPSISRNDNEYIFMDQMWGSPSVTPTNNSHGGSPVGVRLSNTSILCADIRGEPSRYRGIANPHGVCGHAPGNLSIT